MTKKKCRKIPETEYTTPQNGTAIMSQYTPAGGGHNPNPHLWQNPKGGENLQNGDLAGKYINRVNTAVYLILEIFGDNKIKNVCKITGSNWNVRKGTPEPQTTHRPADFMPGEITPPGTSTFLLRRSPERVGEM